MLGIGGCWGILNKINKDLDWDGGFKNESRIVNIGEWRDIGDL